MNQAFEPGRSKTPSAPPGTNKRFGPRPTFTDLAAWAGPDHVTRAQAATIAAWRISDADKVILTTVGIPIVDPLIDYADIQTEPEPQLPTNDGCLLYRLTRNHHGDNSLTWSFGIEPQTGTVYYVMPDAEACLANSSIRHWISALHHYGRYVADSSMLSSPDDYDEDDVLAELRTLAQELEVIDPAAFAGYHGVFWAEFLDRWLW